MSVFGIIFDLELLNTENGNVMFRLRVQIEFCIHRHRHSNVQNGGIYVRNYDQFSHPGFSQYWVWSRIPGITYSLVSDYINKRCCIKHFDADFPHSHPP